MNVYVWCDTGMTKRVGVAVARTEDEARSIVLREGAARGIDRFDPVFAGPPRWVQPCDAPIPMAFFDD